MTIEINLPLPPSSHLPNSRFGGTRTSRIIQARDTKSYRTVCAWATIQAVRSVGATIPEDATPSVTAEIRRRLANLDEDGALRYLKHALDGIADGLHINDRQFKHSIPTQSTTKPYGVTVWITIWP